MWGKILIFFIVITISGNFALADGPPVQWQKTFGGSYYDNGYSVQQTSDGGYVITGETDSFGAGWKDVYLIKTDPNGNSQWQQTFGGSSYDKGYSVQQTADGGYIIAGETSSFGAGYNDVYLIKTDPNGNSQWQKTFGGSATDGAYSVQQTSDGGYIITGWTMSFGAGGHDVYLIKTDPNGNSQWQKTFGGINVDNGHSVQQTSDGGYIIAGDTGSFGAAFFFDVYLIKADPNGNLQWKKTFGGMDWEEGYSVQQTADGGYIIAGGTESFGDPVGDVYLVKTDPNGNSQWQKTFGGSSFDRSCSVQQTTDGGYIIAGGTRSFGAGSYDVYLIKTDPSGNSQWQKTFGGSENDYSYSVQQTSDGGYIIAGRTYSFGGGDYSDVYLIKLCSEGTLAGDLNCDGIIDYEDVEILVSQWLQPRSILYPPADIYGVGDGTANFKDFAVMASQWLVEGHPDPCGMEWVYIDDPGVSGHESFTGEMSKYETTNAQYCQFLNAALASGDIIVSSNRVYGANGSNSGEDFVGEIYFDTYAASNWSQITYIDGVFNVRIRDANNMSNHPVTEVSWYGATAFCNYYGYRLPTEWEWQAVADYDGSYTYGCGTSINQSKANYYDNGYANPLGLSGYPYTSPVDHYSSYGYGMNDMAGNVWEWTDSCYYAGCNPGARVLRGGCWGDYAFHCTVSFRGSHSPYNTDFYRGFRVCR